MRDSVLLCVCGGGLFAWCQHVSVGPQARVAAREAARGGKVPQRSLEVL